MRLHIEIKYVDDYRVSEFHAAKPTGLNLPPQNWPSDVPWQSIDHEHHLIILDRNLHKGVLCRPVPEVISNEPVRQAVVQAILQNRKIVKKRINDPEKIEQEIFSHVSQHEITHALIEEETAATSVSEDAHIIMALIEDSDEETFQSMRARQILLSAYLEAGVDARASRHSNPLAFSTYMLERLRTLIVDDSQNGTNEDMPDNFMLDLLWEVKNKFGIRYEPHGFAAAILITGITDMEDRMWSGEKIYRPLALPNFFKGLDELTNRPDQFISKISHPSFINALSRKVNFYTKEQSRLINQIIDREDYGWTAQAVLNAFRYGLDVSEYQ